MSLTEILLIAAVVLLVALLVLQIVLVVRSRDDAFAELRHLLGTMRDDGERLERGLRDEARAARGEQSVGMDQLRDSVQGQFAQLSQAQHVRIEGFGQRLDQLTQRTDLRIEALRQALLDDARKSRDESAQSQTAFRTLLEARLGQLSDASQQRLAEVRATLETKLKELQADNARQLEAMRVTVDEKLHATLETRLGESFKLVSERLEQVHRGLGEMQGLAAGVGDLKRVLTNVRSRGLLGEVQLAALLEQLLTGDQYASNVATVPGSSERVEFAIRLPGRDADNPVWLPVDAKFPREDYERLLDAQERADVDAAAAAAAALERRMREEARRIRDKYISVPSTTDFAILFVPTEGLYAEIIRRPGLFEALQRDYRVVVTGPTTLSATLNSLQMGFRTLAIEKRSSEVWLLLGAVKTEFGKFGTVLEKTRQQLDTVRNSIDAAGVRTRAIERKLRSVESLSGDESRTLLGDTAGEADEGNDGIG